jgi:mono/diheme cytochrome c family protein
VRVQRQINDHVLVGGSVADVQGKSALGAWVMTDSQWKTKSLATSTVFGQAVQDGVRMNGFLNEIQFRFGNDEKNHLISRFEVVQRTPEQLEIQVAGDARHAEWIQALTVGYEREVLKGKGSAFYVGGSYTKSWVPTSFSAAYGGNPNSAEVHVRLKLQKGKSWAVEAPVPEAVRETYSWIHQNIILQKCISCHSTTQGDGDGLPSGDGSGACFDNYDTLKKVVVDGNPDGSRFYQVVRDHDMPRVMDGQTTPNYLTDTELQAVRDWIAGGAKRN